MFGFKKKIKSVELVSPVNGQMICLKDVPDKVFASEMMGPGVAFISSDGKVYSPCELSNRIEKIYSEKLS